MNKHRLWTGRYRADGPITLASFRGEQQAGYRKIPEGEEFDVPADFDYFATYDPETEQAPAFTRLGPPEAEELTHREWRILEVLAIRGIDHDIAVGFDRVIPDEVRNLAAKIRHQLDQTRL